MSKIDKYWNIKWTDNRIIYVSAYSSLALSLMNVTISFILAFLIELFYYNNNIKIANGIIMIVLFVILFTVNYFIIVTLQRKYNLKEEKNREFWKTSTIDELFYFFWLFFCCATYLLMSMVINYIDIIKTNLHNVVFLLLFFGVYTRPLILALLERLSVQAR